MHILNKKFLTSLVGIPILRSKFVKVKSLLKISDNFVSSFKPQKNHL